MELIDLLNLPLEELVRAFLLPFLILFAVMWGILSAVGIFNRKINIVLSFGLSLLATFTPQFGLFATYLSQFGGQFAIAAFFIVFVIGVAMWGFGRGRDIYREQTGGSTKELEKLQKQREKYLKKARDAEDSGDKAKARAYMKMVYEMDEKIELKRSRS